MTDPYVNAARALISLSRTLVEARAVRFQAPDREPSEDPKPSNRADVSNPTLSTVLDSVRWDLSTEVSLTEQMLEAVALEARAADERLTHALARWNNEKEEDDASGPNLPDAERG